MPSIFGDLTADLAFLVDWLKSFFRQINRERKKKEVSEKKQNKNRNTQDKTTRRKIMNVINS